MRFFYMLLELSEKFSELNTLDPFCVISISMGKIIKNLAVYRVLEEDSGGAKPLYFFVPIKCHSAVCEYFFL